MYGVTSKFYTLFYPCTLISSLIINFNCDFFYFFYHSNEENVNVPSSPSTMQSAFSRNLKTFMGTRILSLLDTGTAMGGGGVCER